MICVNAQNAEVLVIGETLSPTGPRIIGFLNVDPCANNARTWLSRKAPDAFIEDASYGTISQVAPIHFTGLNVLETLLHDGSPLIDPARHLALNLMRKGPSMYAKYHNHHIADEIFQRLTKR